MNASLLFRRWLGRIHLWLGLASGLLVFLISVSGALYAFRDELFDFFHRDKLYLKEEQLASYANAEHLPLSVLLAKAEQALAGRNAKPEWLTTYSDPRRTWEFRAYASEDNAESAVTYFQEVRHDLIAYLNPYTGETVAVLDHEHEFFRVVMMFHWSFLLANDIGQPIVGYSVLVFVLMLISGMILWWPKKIRHISAKLRIPWSAGWKSKFYALHTALGACVMPVALIIASTGLYYAFQAARLILYAAIAWTTVMPDYDMGKSTSPVAASGPLALDAAHASAWKRHPASYSIGYGVPGADDDSATINAYAQDNGMVYYKGSQDGYDRRTGALVKARSFAEAPRGEKYLAMNYDIHVGAIFGLPGKILAFLASLVCASLPVSGFLIWRGRRKRKAAPRPPQSIQPKESP
jgi:uncharacterized iron-regulated membrane protein